MKDNFDACLAQILKYEGGYTDHPSDPGGATNLGITRATLSAWRGRSASKADVKALTVQEAGEIYRSAYWNKINGDTLAYGVDLCVFDAAVNSGPKRAHDWLMASIGGKDTETINRMCDVRLAFLQGLLTWRTFGKGWTNRVKDVRATALRMAVTPPPKTIPVVETLPAAPKGGFFNAVRNLFKRG